MKTTGIWNLTDLKDVPKEARTRKKTSHEITVGKHHRAAHEQDGFSLIRENKTTVRLGKPKPHFELHEDRVWLSLAAMGFKKISSGREFRIPIKGEKNKQVDVYCEDDDFCLVVECKSKEEQGRKGIRTYVDELSGLKDQINESIRSRYEKTKIPAIGWILATSNFVNSKEDINYAEENKIKVITERNLDYFEAITKVSPHMSRQQFAAEIFADERVKGLGGKVPALRGRDGSTTFYSFSVKPETLAKLSFVHHRSNRDGSDAGTYQRLIKPTRIKKIGKFIEEGGVFPTNLVVNIRTEKNLGWQQASKDSQPSDIEGYEDFRHGLLSLPDTYKSIWLIDGQHRLYGYFDPQVSSDTRDRSRVMVTAYENLPREEEVKRFAEINSEQEKVSKALLDQLDAEMRRGSDDPSDRWLWMLSQTVSDLVGSTRSPLLDLINVDQMSNKKGHLSFSSIKQALVNTKFLGSVTKQGKKSNLITYPWGGRDDQETVERIFELVCDYLSWFKEECPHHWNRHAESPDPERSTGGFLCTNQGIQSLLLVLERGIDFIASTHNKKIESTKNQELLRLFKPYVEPIIKYFAEPTYEKVKRFRTLQGTGAPRNYSRWLEQEIMKEWEYKTSGFDDWGRDQATLFWQRRAALLIEVETMTSKIFFSYFEREYGEISEWQRYLPGNALNEAQVQQAKLERDHNIKVDLREGFSMIHFLQTATYRRNNNPRFADLHDMLDLYSDYKNEDKKEYKNVEWMRVLMEYRNAGFHQAQQMALQQMNLTYDVIDDKSVSILEELKSLLSQVIEREGIE